MTGGPAVSATVAGMTTTLPLPALPFDLTPVPAGSWRADPDGVVHGEGGPRTDIFIDPGSAGAESLLNAATALGEPPAGDYQFSARVTVDFAATFDAGVLLLWADERNWAKLCFEYSPAGQPMIVSVVNRGVSDDANAFDVAGNTVWLRIARIGAAYAFHASTDGHAWHLIRVFVLADSAPAPVLVGLEAQSPTGVGCAVRFDEIRFRPETLADLRDLS